jgi:phage virion morphogenesis protein
MPSPVITLEYSDEAIRQKLQQLQQRLGDLQPIYRELGEYLLLSTDIRWEREIDPDGNRWKALTPFTRSQKESLGRIDKILQSTGRLRASIRYRANSQKLVVGTNVKYARNHQLGINGVPQRKFLGLSIDDRQEIIRVLNRYLDK